MAWLEQMRVDLCRTLGEAAPMLRELDEGRDEVCRAWGEAVPAFAHLNTARHDLCRQIGGEVASEMRALRAGLEGVAAEVDAQMWRYRRGRRPRHCGRGGPWHGCRHRGGPPPAPPPRQGGCRSAAPPPPPPAQPPADEEPDLINLHAPVQHGPAGATSESFQVAADSTEAAPSGTHDASDAPDASHQDKTQQKAPSDGHHAVATPAGEGDVAGTAAAQSDVDLYATAAAEADLCATATAQVVADVSEGPEAAEAAAEGWQGAEEGAGSEGACASTAGDDDYVMLDLDRSDLCVMCQSAPKTMAFVHARGESSHLCACADCAKDWRTRSAECPVCHAKCSGTLRVFT